MAGFPVCPKSFLHLLDEREGKLCGVRPPIHFNVFFFLFLLCLSLNTVHHLGSVHVTKNSPGISWFGSR